MYSDLLEHTAYPFAYLNRIRESDLLKKFIDFQDNPKNNAEIFPLEFTKYVLSNLFNCFGVTRENYKKSPLYFFSFVIDNITPPKLIRCNS